MIKTSVMESKNKMDNVYNDMMCVDDECSKMLKDIKLLPIDKVDSFLKETIAFVNQKYDIITNFNVNDLSNYQMTWGVNVITVENDFHKIRVNYDLLVNKPSRYFLVWLCLVSIKLGGWEKDAPCFYDLVPGYVNL
jgi:hypothetical protein